MLSICIPHFNYQNPLLFNTLKEQCERLRLKFEILIIDDASQNNKKKYLQQFERKPFRIIYLDKNIGRSAIRNLLAKEAAYGLLLFLDADGKIEDHNFIKTYLDNIKADIVSGGRAYADLKPDNNHFLHWNYGFNIESKNQGFFHSNNFMIRKSVFDNLRFGEQIKDYGYEDVVFGLEAKLLGISMAIINNKVIHDDLKNNRLFLNDVDQSLINLLKIIDIKKQLQIVDFVGISKRYKFLGKFYLTNLLSIKNSSITEKIRGLLIENPTKNSNLMLTIYKLYKYHQIRLKQKN
ncbi:glycosyltransferase family 2 protein [Pedobacter sp. SD-b]|uniref:Glycosyltransferase family 2 protein n=1 Tax=Pedobacter segetis TaxID=2793069 RepID=A0ABS1BKK9_9SPHI|nr:glycosyltransferase family 2 protein [Pedobacter segetis]MBK0383433.1 glycosyltransferase family 2 protein [Pedobacter segetis]